MKPIHPQLVENYKGVNILFYYNYYFPDKDANVVCNTLREVKEWINDVWIKKLEPKTIQIDPRIFSEIYQASLS